MKQLTFLITIALVFLGCGESVKGPTKITRVKTKSYTSDKDVLMFIVDSSSSMNNLDASGVKKIDAAKISIRDLASQIDKDKTNIGLISFGGGCGSSTLLVEPSNNDVDKVIDASNGMKPIGKTPLAGSIRIASNVLHDIDKNINLVIISDGKDTCSGNAYLELNRLKKQHKDKINVFIVGYSVDDKTKKELQNIADKTGGKYKNANDSADLGSIITSITDDLNVKDASWKGDTFTFKVNFEYKSFEIKPEYFEKIKSLASYMKKTGYKVEIQGHTDSIGGFDYNEGLAKNRAQAVADKLVSFGIDADKIYAVGYGRILPIGDNTTKEGMKENRRVEAHIMKSEYLNISSINNANIARKIDLKDASKISLLGYYEIMDANMNRVYILELYPNDRARLRKYVDKKIVKDNIKYQWSFDKKTRYLKIQSISNLIDKTLILEGETRGTNNYFDFLVENNNMMVVRLKQEDN